MSFWLAGVLWGVAAATPAPAHEGVSTDEGVRVYRAFCATCHGLRGDGGGPAARFLDIPPRDFTLGDFEFTTVPYGSAARVEDIERTVRAGLLGTPMPAFAELLSAREIRAVAVYVRGLVARPLPEGEPIEWTEAPADGAEARERGAALYRGAGCWSCHGAEGRADGPAAATLMTSSARAIRPADLTRGVFKSGRGAPAVFRVVSTGLPGTPMPAYAHVLSVEQRWDLAHYVASLAREPRWWERLWTFLFSDPAGRSNLP